MAENGSRSLRDRILKRLPLRDDLGLVLETSGLYRFKRRAALITFDVPAGALVAGGGVYYPPNGGGRVKFCGIGPEGASGWKFGLITAADLATSGTIGGTRIGNVNTDAPINGNAESFQFFGVGDHFGNLAQGTIAYPELDVFPPNLFFVSLTTDNLVAEGGFYIEEYLSGDEEL